MTGTDRLPDARSGDLPVGGRAVRLFITTGIALGLLWFLRGALAPDTSQRGLEFFPDMSVSPAFGAQEASDLFPDGAAERQLVEGVVPRGGIDFPYGDGEEEAKRAGAALTSPVEAGDERALERGRILFGRFCTPCHDAAGEGKGAVVLRGMFQPPSFLAVRAMEMQDGQVFHVITRGQGNMASYALQIRQEDRWKIVAHVRALQQGGASGGADDGTDDGSGDGTEEDE